MGLIDLVLNLAGTLLWLGWRSMGLDPLVKATPVSLVGTLRRAEPRRLRGWQLLVGLTALLLLRAALYCQIGPEVNWTPKLNLFFVVLAFHSHLFLPSLLYSILSFGRLLIICYFWMLVLVIINRRTGSPDPVLKALRAHLSAVARWPRLLQWGLPLLSVAALWIALHPLLVQQGIDQPAQTHTRLAGQGMLVGAALYLSLQYLLPGFLFAHLVASYVYLGDSPLWDFINATARNLLAPLRRLPLQIAHVDLAPVVGVALIFVLLHWLPDLIVRKMALHQISFWPQ